MIEFTEKVLKKIKINFKYENIFKDILYKISEYSGVEDIFIFVRDNNVQGLKPFIGIGKYSDASILSSIVPAETVGKKGFIPLRFSGSVQGGIYYDGDVELNINDNPTLFLIVLFFINSFVMYRETNEKINRMTTLYEIAKFTNYLVSPTNTLYSLIDIVKSIVRYDSCGIYTFEENKLVLKYFMGITPSENISEDDYLYKQIVLNKKSLLGHKNKYKSFMAIPLLTADKLTGALVIGSLCSYEYSNDDIVALSIVSSQLSSMDSIFSSLINVKGLTTTVVDSINQGILTIDFEKKINMYNAYAKNYFPELKSSIGKDLSQIFSLSHPVYKILENTMEKGIIYDNKRYQLDNKSFEFSSFPLKDETGYIVGVGIYFRDIKEIMKLEDRLKFRDRIQIIGELSASIAHEIKNPLAGIKMVTQLLSDEIHPENTSKKEYTNVILEEVDRLDKLINELLDFGKPSNKVFDYLNIHEVVESINFLLKKDLASNMVDLKINTDSELPMIFGDRSQFKQLFINIIKNSINALNKVHREKKEIFIDIYKENDNVFVKIRDNGTGIKKTDIDRIFDIFYTTGNEGTGLGMSVVQKIVEAHSGDIHIESVAGEYTEILIRFPIMKK